MTSAYSASLRASKISVCYKRLPVKMGFGPGVVEMLTVSELCTDDTYPVSAHAASLRASKIRRAAAAPKDPMDQTREERRCFRSPDCAPIHKRLHSSAVS